MDFIKEYYVQLSNTEPALAVLLQIAFILAIMLIISRTGLLVIHLVFKRWSVVAQKKEKVEQKQLESMKHSVRKVWNYSVLMLAFPVSIAVFNLSLDSYKGFRESILAIPLIGLMIRLILIFLISYLALKAGCLAIKIGFDRQRQEQIKKKKGFFKKVEIKQSKLNTLETLSLSIYKYAVYFTAGLSILSVFGISTSTVITGAGVLGVAVGFGAQNLVRDVIAGAFIMFEDQFDVGDYIEGCGLSGTVVGIGLRSTQVKGFDGALHYIPNGELKIVSNHSRNYRRAMIDIGVSYEESLEEVTTALENICLDIRQKSPFIIDGPKVLGVQQLGESEVVFRIVAMTEPNEQWRTERLLRYNIKNKFDELGISIPYPHRVVINTSLEKK